MTSNPEIVKIFFHDLKHYNSTNFRTLEKADLSKDDPAVHKAFSSVVTRYFIFRERHPEITVTDSNILFFKLKIDMIARYFSEYPAASLDDLRPFQQELIRYVRESKGDEDGISNESIKV